MISFDIAKAYDTVFRNRIIEKLNKIIAKGNILDFVCNFLKHRSFQVKTPSTLSDTFPKESSVPQESTISVRLFLITINNISQEITFPYIPLPYAEDFTNLILV